MPSQSHHIQCTPQELAVLLPAFNRIAQAFEPVQNSTEVGFSSGILNDVIATLPKFREPIRGLLSAISLKKASEGEKHAMWVDVEKFPVIDDITMASIISPSPILYWGLMMRYLKTIQVIECELMDELKNSRLTYFGVACKTQGYQSVER